MYSLTIHFGPNAICWAFLFKNKTEADLEFARADTSICDGSFFRVEDDFGQIGVFAAGEATGILFEGLDQIEAARIQRALAEERCKVKLMAAAKADPVIRQAMQGGPQVLQPRFNG